MQKKTSAKSAFTTTSVVGGGVTAWWEVLKHRLIKEGNVGYSEAWITRRIKTIEIRKGLTDEWKRGGVTKENLRDNMTNMELLLNSLAEEAAEPPGFCRSKAHGRFRHSP
ncbi:MAG: hypothetical protein II047_07600 [Bacteroidales bacterium]|nr:hypothetical protein [Bacteroidales bacterium]